MLKYSSNPKHTDNTLLKLTFSFAIDVAKYCEKLEERKKWNVANQLFRSGTSVGANSREAQNAESRLDFVHKLKIALKEAEETEYWLFLCQELYKDAEIDSLLTKVNELLRLLNSIISTSKNNAR
jgi:four helix bundle protein